VPKGPSKDPKVKRLAIRVEDHPLDYLLFEGTLPEGDYGAGEVIVWDFGEFDVVRPEGGDAAGALGEGIVRLALHGTKLRGQWTRLAVHRVILAGDRSSTRSSRRPPYRLARQAPRGPN